LRNDVDSGRLSLGDLFTRDGTGHLTAAGNRRVAQLLRPALESAQASLRPR
jgi:hypothetical protein